MNKQLKELLEQSGLQAYYDAQNGQIEKFAELIVKECINIVDDTDMSRLEGPNPDDVLFVAITQIKEHFGVEE